MPAVAAPIFSCEAALALLTASLKAAATRSSAISGSDSTLGSMRTLRHSMRPVRVTATMPPPALPVTSRLASSSCTRCMFSCIFCACCISWAMFPRMSFSLFVVVADRIGHQLRAVLRHQPLPLRIGEEGAFAGGRALAALAFVARMQGLGDGLRGVEADLRLPAQRRGQRRGQLRDEERRLEVIVARRQRQPQHAI